MLTLQHFLLKPKVIGLYRSAIRASRGMIVLDRLPRPFISWLTLFSHLNQGIPQPQARAETIAWIRQDFERNRYVQDVVSFWFLPR